MSINEIINREKKWHISINDSLSALKSMPNSFAQVSITSPPYFNLRNYNSTNEIGSEDSPKDYIEQIVTIYKEIKRVIRRDAVCWINIGDKYAVNYTNKNLKIKNKDLMLLPWELAKALQKDRWYIRQMIPWVKPNSVPENVNDRPNTSLEYVIMLSKNKNYYFDMEGAKKCSGINRNWRNGDSLLFMDVQTKKSKYNHPATMPKELVEIMLKSSTSEKGCCAICHTPIKRIIEKKRIPPRKTFSDRSEYYSGTSRNSTTSLGSWNPETKSCNTEVKTIGWKHNCKCNTEESTNQIIIDPFSGSGTTGSVALGMKHSYIGIELSKVYANESIQRLKIKEKRINSDIFG
jgi:site-specific DNA-methyltransferase (cytosine-N4-specific)